jgi:hypothetical protein
VTAAGLRRARGRLEDLQETAAAHADSDVLAASHK